MDNPSFEYTYSSQRQKEVEEIRSAYLPKEEDKMTALRRLHAIPTQKAQAVSLAVGIIGTLLLGTGMSLCMTDIGSVLGNFALIIGIMIRLAGIALISAAYPVFNRVLKKERERIAPEILRLSDELIQ